MNYLTRRVEKITHSMLSLFKRRSFALYQLDVKLERYLRRRKGFFIEAGANDGISQSNTLYFERYFGWRGLLIEAIPTLAEKCRVNRPKCIVENCALVAFGYPEGTIEMQYRNLMSFVKGSLGSDVDRQKHFQSELQFLANGEQVYDIRVPARTLSDILEKNRIHQIDLLSLDVEGYEAQVLSGLDLDRFHPEFLLLEVRNEEGINTIIGDRYEQVDVLHHSKSFSDVLYRLR